MKFNGQNIIADSDIVMTGANAGHDLSEILNQHENDISNLKSNVKWIYKYGGVGSGSGGGSGSASSAPWNFKVEIDDVVREDNSIANLGKLKEYKLTILLYKVQGRTFTVKYTYDTPQGIKITEKTIPPTSSSIITDVIDLLVNGTLAIAINDDEGNYDLFTLQYVVTAYSFAIDYVYKDDKSIYYPLNNNIFVGAVASRGLQARFTSIISVDVLSYYIEYTDWNLEHHVEELSINDKYFYFDLGKELTNDNSGNYQFSIIPHIILKGNNEEEKVEPYELSDNLIPDNIYLKVETDGILYNSNSVQNPYLFYSGVVSFFVTGFLGFLDLTKVYLLKVYLNDVLYQDELLVSELLDQRQYELKILTDVLEWNSIKFCISRKGETYEKTYYFNTKSSLGDFNWYPQQTIDGEATSIYPIKSYQYKYANTIHNKALELIPNYKNLISMTATTATKIYSASLDNNTYKNKDCLLSVGISYNKLNDTELPILMFGGSESTNNIIIYLNKISIMGSVYDNFYIPMGDDKFHLIDIYRRAVSESNTQPLFEFVVYIDGVLECAIPGFTTMLETYNKVTLYGGLYQINYLEMSYFNHSRVNDDSLDLLELYNPNPTKYKIDFLTDSSILYHYYSYKLTFYPESVSEEFLKAYAYVSQFYNNTKTGRIEVNKTMIGNLASNIDIPVLLVKHIEPRDETLGNWSSDGQAFMSWMERSIDVTKDPNATKQGKNVEVEYSKGKLELVPIDIKSKFPNAFFTLFLQGTSTLIYTSKNFDLEVNSSEEDFTYLYSPNFDSKNPSTFLPESRFTIKSDVVDSSHSNNDAIGKFINAISTKFEDAKLENIQYSNYIKNTLEGFPVLLFLQNSYYVNNTTQTTKDDFYFLGIYNFNLGRDSEFNLGFKDLRLLPESIEEGFAVTRIQDVKINGVNISPKSYLNNLGVMEIRDNKNYYDFSQSRNSILFPVSNDDTDYMFSKFKSNNEEILKTSIQNMVLGVSKGGGYIFDLLGKNMIGKEPNDVLGYGYDEGYKTDVPKNIVPNYKVELERTFVDARSVLTPTGVTITGGQNDLVNTLLGDQESGEDPLLDYTSLTEYYVICMALGLLDSVLKNMNFRKWKKKFYLAFYDMDTSLGKDNAGNNSDYLCFSDYWKPNSRVLGGTTILEPAISYKDWYDKNVSGGYDVPSSYLFALAKYGYHVYNDDELKDWYPLNIWARFRRKDLNIPNWSLPNGRNSNHIGCLVTADAFIDNYYANHLSKVPDVLFNLNYRAKYLQVENTGYKSDYGKFSGRRIHYVRDWLNSRFHLLDLYFNIARVADLISVYNMETNTWTPIENSNYTLPEAIFIDQSNKDLLVLYDAFTTNDGSSKYSQNLNVTFSADTHSPLSLAGAVIGRYITEENTKDYNLYVDCNGKSLNLGGSGSWLTLNSINTLIQGNKLYAHSDKLTTLIGTSNACYEWNLNLPALKTVSLTSSLYSGTLTFSGIDNWPNLTSIDISGSKLSLNLDNLRVKSVNASGVGPANELVIANCQSLTSLNLKNSIFNTITLSPLLSETFLSTYKYEKNLEGVWQKTSILADSPKCKFLSLTRTKGDGVIFISDLTFTNNGITDGLREVTLTGYREIYIDNCPYLEKLNITDPQTVRILHIRNSSSSTTSLSILSDDLYTINLSACTNLQEVDFYYTRKFKFVYLPENRSLGNGVLLKSLAFSYTDILYLSGKYLKLKDKVFLYSSNFTLLQNNQSLCSFDTSQTVENLSYLFYMTKVSYDTFTRFNTNYSTWLNKVKIVDGMWAYCPGITYDENTLLEDYKSGKCRFNLSMYMNVTSAKKMMGGKNVTSCHPDTLKGFGSASGVNLENFYGWDSTANQTVTLPLTWLTNVKNKVTNCNTTGVVIYKVVTYNAINLNLEIVYNINPKDLFLGNSSNKLTSFVNWVFSEEHTLNFKDALLPSLFPKLTTITKSFVGCKGENLQYNQTINGITESKGFLYQNLNIVDISGSFGFTNYNTITVSLNSYLDWNKIQENNILYKGFKYTVDWDEKYHVMLFLKIINGVEIFNNIYSCLMGLYSANSLSHLFQNCKIDNQGSYSEILFTGLNSNIKSIPYLFSNFSIIQEGEYLPWDWDIINTIPSVVDFRHAFEKNRYKGSIPFNFFKRRKLSSPELKYIKNDSGNFEQALLYKYTYTSNISNLSHCFEDCVFEYPTYIPGEELLTNNKSRLQQDDIVLDNLIYYNTNNAFATAIKLDNVEFDDLDVKITAITTLNDSWGIVRSTTTFEAKEYENYRLEYSEDDITKSIVPTDFFYGCANAADLTYCFANTNLQGYIPDNLLKNCKNARIGNFLKGTLVFPKEYGKRYNTNLDKKLNIYYYIGSNFCTTTNLDNAFNFRINLPGLKSIDSNDLHVFCFSDSFSVNITSVKDMLPADINPAPEGCFFSIQHLDHEIFMNTMYDKETELDFKYPQDSEGNEITTDSNGSPIEELPVIGNLGFNLSKYSNLLADHLINSLFSLFMYGNVFDDYTTLLSIKHSSDWVIKFGGYNNSLGVSKYAIWPSTKGLNQKLIYSGHTTYLFNGSTWESGDGYGMCIFKDKVKNWNDTTGNFYNDSRVNKSGYSINFINNE